MKKCKTCTWYNDTGKFCNLSNTSESPQSYCDEYKCDENKKVKAIKSAGVNLKAAGM